MNQAQQDVLDQLGSTPDERPEFPVGLGAGLRAQLEEALADIAAEVPSAETLNVSKHALASVHGCEARFLHEEAAPFEISVPIARGSVAHKAIELSMHWPVEPNPLDLVDEATARLSATDHWLADWLQTCSEADRAELRSEANDRVIKFLECWPPLQPRWHPATEQTLRAELCGGQILLRGKVDLTIGRTQGQVAGKVVVDFKTGGWSPAHIDDLRFYALIDTLRLGTPPRRLASYYLESATLRAEDVTVAMLEATVARVADGAARLWHLRTGQAEPVKRPSIACRWCSLLETCDEGNTFLRQMDDD